MSYVVLDQMTPNPSSRRSEDGYASDSGTPATRRNSSFPLLDSRRSLSVSPSRKDPIGWLQHRDTTSSRRKFLVYSCIVALCTLSTLLYIGTDEERVEGTLSMLRMGGRPLLLKKAPRKSPPLFKKPLTNPLLPSERLGFNSVLTIEKMPSSVYVSQPASLIVRCGHRDLTWCPQSYRTLLIGPSIRSTRYEESEVIDERNVKVTFRVDDPGEYKLYMWPESKTCDQWVTDWTLKPYHKLAVIGTPLSITVKGSAPEEGDRACTRNDNLLDGRWISRRHLSPDHLRVGSPFLHWAETHLNPYPTDTRTHYERFGYLWTPYSCKIPHRSFFEWVDEVKPASVLVMGDSHLRDFFCFQWGYDDRKTCHYSPFEQYTITDKKVSLDRADGSTTDLSFHFNDLADSTRLQSYISSLPKPPSHVLFNLASEFGKTNVDPKDYVERMRTFVETLLKVAPKAKVTALTSGSVVQAIECFDLLYDRRELGRVTLEPLNKALLSLLKEFPSVTALDTYRLYNDRPDASQDGQKWEKTPGSTFKAKNEEGAVGWALTDVVFENWRTQGK